MADRSGSTSPQRRAGVVVNNGISSGYRSDPRTLAAVSASGPTFGLARRSPFGYAPRPSSIRAAPTVALGGYLPGAGSFRAYSGAEAGTVEVNTTATVQQIKELVTYTLSGPADASSFQAAMDGGPDWARTPATNTAGVWLRIGMVAAATMHVRLRLSNRWVPVLQDPPSVRILAGLVYLSISMAANATLTSATHYAGGWLLSLGPQLAAQIVGIPNVTRSSSPQDMQKLYLWGAKQMDGVQATGAAALLRQLSAGTAVAAARDKSGPHAVKGYFKDTPLDPESWGIGWEDLPTWAKFAVGAVGVGAIAFATSRVGGLLERRGAKKKSKASKASASKVLENPRRGNPRRSLAKQYGPWGLLLGGIALSMVDGPAPLADFVGIPMATAGGALLVARAS